MPSALAQRSSPTRLPHFPARSRGPYRRPARKASASPSSAAAIMITIAGPRRSVPAYARKPTSSSVASAGATRPKITAVSPATRIAATM